MEGLANFTAIESHMNNVTNVTVKTMNPPSATVQAIITVVYLFGLLGNTTALFYLLNPKSKPRNPRHVLLLTLLLINDLTAVIGMWTQMNISIHYKAIAQTKAFCSLRVIWRAFGLGSGCIVTVMAIDRWLALTRPFYYTKHVTVSCLRKGTIILWLLNLLVVCMPFAGFGAYYDDRTNTCVRYKNATLPKDVAYAYLYMTFGALLCSCLVVSNFWVICSLTLRRKSKRLVRRHSRNRDLVETSTAEESAFARVMMYISFSFLLSWTPQIASVPVAQMVDPKACGKYFRIADIVLATHFVIDPYIYILQKFIVFSPSKWCRKPNSRTSSMKTSNEMCSL